MKLRKLVDSIGSLNELSGIKLPAKISFKISVLLNDLNDVFDNYEKSKNELIMEHGIETDEGYKIPEENYDMVNQKLSDLLEEEVPVEFEVININDIGDVEIEPKILLGLTWLFK